jgi:hypothetical protein
MKWVGSELHLEHGEIRKLCGTLEGTSDSIEQGIAKAFAIEVDDGYSALTNEALDEIDRCIFLCADCEWWHALSEAKEVDGRDTCRECRKGNEDLDDD